jgi:tetratricopeptide (TPR) repeat protein
MSSERDTPEWDLDAELAEAGPTGDSWRLDDSLLEQLAQDARLSSGLPKGQRLDDDAFILQSGLTRPRIELSQPARAEADSVDPEELDPESPLSFYEQGVRDVDEGGNGHPAGEVLGKPKAAPPHPASAAPLRATKSARETLSEILNELGVEAPEPPLEAAPPASPVDPEDENGGSESLASLLNEMADDGEDAAEHALAASFVPAPEDDEPDSGGGDSLTSMLNEMADQGPDAVDAALAAAEVPTPNELDDTAFQADASLAAMLGEMAESGEESVVEGLDDATAEFPAEAFAGADFAPETPDNETEGMPTAPSAHEPVGPAGDFDSFIAAMSAPEPEPEPASAPEPEPEPEPEPAAAAAARTLQSRLGEAEALLQQLEAQPRDAQDESPAPPPVPQGGPVPAPAARAHAMFSSDPPPRQDDSRSHGHVEYDYDAAPARRNASRVVRRRARLIGRAAALLVTAALCVAGYFAYQNVVREQILSPEEMLARGEERLADGLYAGASEDFEAFAARATDDPRRADAQFNAALAARMASANNPDARRAADERALKLLENFVQAHPAHPKRARAESLIGLALHGLNRHEEAIPRLRAGLEKPEDPLAALALLRALAGAYAMTGALEEAEATYLQAAAAPKNYTADLDYSDLGEVFARRAEATLDESQRLAYLAKAEEYLTQARNLPVSDPDARNSLDQRLAMLRPERAERIPATPATAPALAASATTEPIPMEPTSPAATDSPEVAAPQAAPANEPDPYLEAQELGHAPITQP